MPRGGARPGAGRKPKPLSQRLAEGNRGHRPLKQVQLKGAEKNGKRPKPPLFLEISTQNKANKYGSAVDFFEEIVDWLEPTGCMHLIPPTLIAQYALAKYFLIDVGELVGKMGVINYKSKGRASPMGKGGDELEVTAAAKGFSEYLKNVTESWNQIYAIVRDNSTAIIKNPEMDFVMRTMAARPLPDMEDYNDEQPDADDGA